MVNLNDILQTRDVSSDGCLFLVSVVRLFGGVRMKKKRNRFVFYICLTHDYVHEKFVMYLYTGDPLPAQKYEL